MPLFKGKSKKIIGKNIKELMKGKMGMDRKKAMKTMMKKSGMTMSEARRKQAVAIAYNKAGKSKKRK